MRTYYIYMLGLKGITGEEMYYIGKTYQLEKRLQDHINKNRKSSKILKTTEVAAIKEIHKIAMPDYLEIPEQDSITSRIENKFITEKIHEDGGNKARYRGGCYLLGWETNNFNLLDLNDVRYLEELALYNLRDRKSVV